MFWWNKAINQKLDAILATVQLLQKQETKMAVDLTTLTAEVTNNTSVTNSVIQLVQNLATQLAAIASGSGDAATQTALNALVATLQTNDSSIATAVTANTPAAAGSAAVKSAS